MGCTVGIFIFSLLWAAGFSDTVLISEKPPITQECYTAAVYEHVKRYGTIDVPPQTVMDWNLEMYEKAADEAKKQEADIIVFPEYGLFGITNDNRSLIRPYLEDIPSPKESRVPCDEPQLYSNNSFLVRLSCAAKQRRMYLVANVGDMKPCTQANDPQCPDDGAYQYNTNVAFDREGRVVGRYHKKHLFFEYKFDVPTEDDDDYFDTEFGRFASFVCFDIVYGPAIEKIQKYGIDTMVFTTWWFDGQPFLVSTQIQQAFAMINNVNLLASNIHRPAAGSIGSGVYAGVNGVVNHVHNPNGRPKLVISRIPSKSGAGKTCRDPLPPKVIEFESELNDTLKRSTPFTSDISQYALVWLRAQRDSITTCHNGFCCTLHYELADGGYFDGSYYFGVYNGSDDVRRHYFWRVQACMVVKIRSEWVIAGHRPPVNSNPDELFEYTTTTRFKSLSLHGSFSTPYVYPSVLGDQRKLIDKEKWTSSQCGGNLEGSRRSVCYSSNYESFVSINDLDEPILSLGLYGRDYERDPPYKR